jgi:DNA polymerase-3 subunit delta'
LLISGAEGLGKRRLAEQIAALLLCEKPQNDSACETCIACNSLHTAAHADLLELHPEEPGKAIKIDQIRELVTALGMTSHRGRFKVVIIDPADAMNINAANSLLKTLEEPTDDTLLMLLSASPGRLPATIRSRCQHLKINSPADAMALQWIQENGVPSAQANDYLAAAQGVPGKALDLAATDGLLRYMQVQKTLLFLLCGRQDPVQIAAEWSADAASVLQTLNWWMDWIRAATRWQQAGLRPAQEKLAHMLQEIVETVDCRQLYGLYDRIFRAVPHLGSGLNRQLLLEDLLIEWAGLNRRRTQQIMPDRQATRII